MSGQEENPYDSPHAGPTDAAAKHTMSLRGVVAGLNAAIAATTATVLGGVVVVRMLDVQPSVPLTLGLTLLAMLSLFAAWGVAARRANRRQMSRITFLLLLLLSLGSVALFWFLARDPEFKEKFVEMRALRELVDKYLRQ
jgi:4-amino-4-deoxy-L-arabinose transferase-like glycosyltransferase